MIKTTDGLPFHETTKLPGLEASHQINRITIELADGRIVEIPPCVLNVFTEIERTRSGRENWPLTYAERNEIKIHFEAVMNDQADGVEEVVSSLSFNSGAQ